MPEQITRREFLKGAATVAFSTAVPERGQPQPESLLQLTDQEEIPLSVVNPPSMMEAPNQSPMTKRLLIGKYNDKIYDIGQGNKIAGRDKDSADVIITNKKGQEVICLNKILPKGFTGSQHDTQIVLSENVQTMLVTAKFKNNPRPRTFIFQYQEDNEGSRFFRREILVDPKKQKYLLGFDLLENRNGPGKHSIAPIITNLNQQIAL